MRHIRHAIFTIQIGRCNWKRLLVPKIKAFYIWLKRIGDRNSCRKLIIVKPINFQISRFLIFHPQIKHFVLFHFCSAVLIPSFDLTATNIKDASNEISFLAWGIGFLLKELFKKVQLNVWKRCSFSSRFCLFLWHDNGREVSCWISCQVYGRGQFLMTDRSVVINGFS